MLEKEIKKYQKYLKTKNKDKVNWINRIRFWEFIKEDLKNSIKENYKKQDRTEELKRQLTSTTTALKVATERIEQLEYDLKQKEKKTRKKKKDNC